MSDILKLPRNGCALHGALQTVQKIQGLVPIVHATGGCAIQNYLANKAGNYYSPQFSGNDIPGTAIQERHIIFGGASRLREQIKNAVKVTDGQVYIVLNSCPSAMVGDDVDAMCREAQQQGEPVIDSLSAGFHGDVHYGYQKVLTDIISGLEKLSASASTTTPLSQEDSSEKEIPVVNIFGIIPDKDIFFKGDLTEITRLLNGVGIKVNTFFNSPDGLEQIKKAKDASLSIVFGEWGKEPAQKLEELYKVPFIQFDSAPLGFDNSKDFLHKVIEKFSGSETEVYKKKADDFLTEEEQKFNYHLASVREAYYENHLGRRIAIVGDTTTAAKYSKFLQKYFSAQIDTIIITDFFPTETLTSETRAEQLKSLAENIYFSQDATEITKLLQSSDSDIILGSSLEEDAAEKKSVPLLEISYPVFNRLILTKSHTGISGAFSFIEDYASVCQKQLQS